MSIHSSLRTKKTATSKKTRGQAASAAWKRRRKLVNRELRRLEAERFGISVDELATRNARAKLARYGEHAVIAVSQPITAAA